MARTLYNQYELQHEVTATPGASGVFSGSQYVMGLTGDLDPQDRYVQADDETHDHGGGYRGSEPMLSQAIERAFNFIVPLEGVGTAAVSTAPTVTALAVALNSFFQNPAAQLAAPTPPGTPTLVTTGSTVDTAASAVSWTEAVGAADYHELPTAGAIGIVGVGVGASTNYQYVPYQYTTATRTFGALIALSTTPSVGDVLLGGITLPLIRSWTSQVPYCLHGRLVHPTQALNKGFTGMVLDKLTIPAVEMKSNKIAMFSGIMRAFGHESSGFALAKQNPTSAVSISGRRDRIKMAPFGATTFKQISAYSCGVDFGRPLDPDTTFNDTYSNGCTGWSPMAGGGGFDLVVPADETPCSGLTDSTFVAMSNSNRTAGNLFQLQWEQGIVGGRTVVVYGPCCSLAAGDEFKSAENMWMRRLSIKTWDPPYTIGGATIAAPFYLGIL